MQPPASTDWQPPAHPPRIPLAFLDIQCDVPGHFVAADNFALGELLARHAFKSGARRVAIIGKPSLNRLVLRVKGMKHAFTTESDCAFEVVEEGAWNSAHDGLDLGRQLGAVEGLDVRFRGGEGLFQRGGDDIRSEYRRLF